MSRSAKTPDNLSITELIPSQEGKAITDFPAGAIAHAWSEMFSQKPTWAGLTQWLRGIANAAN